MTDIVEKLRLRAAANCDSVSWIWERGQCDDGRQAADQAQLFYEFNLEDRVPPSHLLRRINVFVTGAPANLHEELRSHYSHTGRPSIDPELMIRMLIAGYCYGIRSERRLCEEVELNLAYRWFCRLDLDDKVPDHSTFSKYRHGRFRDSDVLRHVFERVVAACIATGLVGGDGFAVDASLIEADANKQRSIPGTEWSNVRDPATANHAVREYLATLDAAVFDAASDVVPKFVSSSDPAAQWTGAIRTRAGRNGVLEPDHGFKAPWVLV